MTIYTDTLETGENVYMIASEPIFSYLRLKHTILLNIYIVVDKWLFVYVLVFVTLVIWSCSLYWLNKQETWE